MKNKYTRTRWQQFYLDDPRLGAIPPSGSARKAATIFAKNNCQAILDLGCGTGRDTIYLASSQAKVFGLDAAPSGLTLAQRRAQVLQLRIPWVGGDARFLPFPDTVFDGVYCFGLLHEFVGASAVEDVGRIMSEVQRVLKPPGVVILATAAGDPEKGLPHVQNFSEAMFDAATVGFHCVEKTVFDDLGCTGRTDYKVWYGQFVRK